MQNAVKERNLVGNVLHHYSEQNKKGATEKHEIEIISEKNKSGFSARVDQQTTFHVGNAQMMDEQGIQILNATANRTYIAMDSMLIATIDLKDELRSDAITVVDELRRTNKEVMLCTGADRATAEHYAQQLGIASENIFSDVVGAQAKEKIVSDHMKSRHIAFIGDAANDLKALQIATVGIAVSNADKRVAKLASVFIEKDGLSLINHFLEVSNKTDSIIKQNLTITFIYNFSAVFLCMGLTAAGLGIAAPAVMALCMTVQSLLIIANTSRIRNPLSLFSTPRNQQGHEAVMENFQSAR